MKTDDARRADMREAIAEHCLQIEDLFRVPVKVTCIVRVPGNPEADVLVTIDDQEVSAVLERSKQRTAF